MTKTMETEYVEGYRPGYLGRIAELHGAFYGGAWGLGADFEGLMAEEMREFFAHYQEGRDLLLTAHVDGRLVGSVAVEGSQAERPGARLRWVIVDGAFNGRGIGGELVRRAMDFCREAGFDIAYLWTVEELPRAVALYERTGFRTVERFFDDRWSLPRTSLRMEADLR